MAGVGDEAPFVLERGLEPGEHLVQRLREARDLVAGGGLGEPRPGVEAEITSAARAHRLDRSKGCGREPVARNSGEQQRERPGQQELAEQMVERLVAGDERARDNERRRTAANGRRLGEQPPALLQARQVLGAQGPFAGGNALHGLAREQRG